MILHGRNLIIKVGGVAIAAAKSCDISVKAKEIPVSAPSGGQWEHSVIGRKSWSVSTNQLVTSIVRPLSMVGTTVSLSMEVDGDLGKSFQGFVDNVSVEQSSLPAPAQAIYWDKTNKRFVAMFQSSPMVVPKYYMSWQNGESYMSPSDYDIFSYNGDVYTWLANDLAIEKMSGNANVVTWRATGAVGNLAQGSFQFNGNGALEAASLPST